MAQYCNILHNITKVEVIEARYLKDINIIRGVGVVLKYWRNFTNIPLSTLAEVEMTTAVENKSRLFAVKLTAHSPQHFDVADRDLCFRVTTVSGSRYLIGTDTRPFPVVNTVDLFPSSTTEKSGCTIVAEYKNTFGMLPILDK